MSSIARLIAVKIVITAVCWAPLIIPGPYLFQLMGVPLPQPQIFTNLLGAAYVALLAVYVRGFHEARAGRHPALVIHVGIISNGLAALLLAGHGWSGAWTTWSRRGQIFMWASLVATTLLTAGLVRLGPARSESG